MNDIKLIGYDLESSKRRFENERAGLFNEAGQPIYTDHNERLAEIARKEQNQLQRIAEEADSLKAKLKSEMEVHEAPKALFEHLSPEELQAAENGQARWHNFAFEAKPPALASKLQALVSQGDKAALYGLSQVLKQRLSVNDTSDPSAIFEPHRTRLYGLIRQAESAITGQDTSKEKAADIRQSIVELERLAYRARSAANPISKRVRL